MHAKTLLKDPVLGRDGWRCVYCGKSLLDELDQFVTYTRDHLAAERIGGRKHPSNLVTSCCACDRLKSGRRVSTIAEARAVIDRQRQKWAVLLEEIRQAVRVRGVA